VRVRRVRAGDNTSFSIGENGELFSWGHGRYGVLGHGDALDQLSPKRVEALLGVRVSTVSAHYFHALVLAGDGLVYAWGDSFMRAFLGDPHVTSGLLPIPVETLRGVRVGSVIACSGRSYAVTDTGELWAWGVSSNGNAPLGHGERVNCPLPKRVKSMRGIKVDAVLAGMMHTLALADDGSVCMGCGRTW
jgi:E3 ubiquitin-protein ligase HERC2